MSPGENNGSRLSAHDEPYLSLSFLQKYKSPPLLLVLLGFSPPAGENHSWLDYKNKMITLIVHQPSGNLGKHCAALCAHSTLFKEPGAS